ncbi:centromere protein O [Thamnophis elegans]|uniref:centromere protein O n=1 Tax=Thamnophis elegans TaxID=35005 RepID=UPI0013789022|nr:centromere protein O [Thamnophis elegans]XP_032072289.1 centromere protein O [Thamnophis elegans]XP_032072290.1 centromere protein O [Thamnophis elegans]
MGEIAISFSNGTLSHLEKLEASARNVVLKQEKIREHEEKILKMKMKIQDLRSQRDELKTKLNVCQSRSTSRKDAMKNSLQVSKATTTNQEAIFGWKIENAKGLLELFRLTGLSGKLTEKGASFCITTAFEGTYLDSYYLDILIQQPLRIQHHSIPVFIPLEQIAHEHLQKDIKCFLTVLSDHLNAYARRKFQVDQLQERFAVFLEGCMKGNSLYNQLEFNYRITEDGSFPFTAKIIYGNATNALPTKVIVVCKAKDAPKSVGEMAAAHLPLFYEKPLQEVFISITASDDNLNQSIAAASSSYSGAPSEFAAL